MSVVVSCQQNWNLDTLLERLWDEMELARVYTKKRGEFPDFSDPLVLTPQRGTPDALCRLKLTIVPSCFVRRNDGQYRRAHDPQGIYIIIDTCFIVRLPL